MNRATTGIAAGLTLTPAVWLGSCTLFDGPSRDTQGNLQGISAVVAGSPSAADTLSDMAGPLQIAPGTIGDTAAIINGFAKAYAAEITPRLDAIDARAARTGQQVTHMQYVGAGVGSTVGAALSTISAYFAGRRRRDEPEAKKDTAQP